jgi:hypothetical protein
MTAMTNKNLNIFVHPNDWELHHALVLFKDAPVT